MSFDPLIFGWLANFWKSLFNQNNNKEYTNYNKDFSVELCFKFKLYDTILLNKNFLK